MRHTTTGSEHKHGGTLQGKARTAGAVSFRNVGVLNSSLIDHNSLLVIARQEALSLIHPQLGEAVRVVSQTQRVVSLSRVSLVGITGVTVTPQQHSARQIQSLKEGISTHCTPAQRNRRAYFTATLSSVPKPYSITSSWLQKHCAAV